MVFIGLSFGSSPLTRGKLFMPSDKPVRGRLIPAHAGKTTGAAPPSMPVKAHPRSRGENSIDWFEQSNRKGSSPLTRGKLAGAVVVRLNRGLIPAHAGKTR